MATQPATKQGRECLFCDRSAIALGLCRKHYGWAWYHRNAGHTRNDMRDYAERHTRLAVIAKRLYLGSGAASPRARLRIVKMG